MAINVTAILVSLAISAALSIVSRLLAPNRQAPQLGGQLPTIRDPGTQLTLRNAAEPHNIVVGSRRAKGNIVFAHCTGGNAQLHLVIEWAGHKCNAARELYFNDEIVPLDGSGNATGKYAGHAVCKDHLGDPDQAADADLIAACPDKWTTEHRGRGRTYSYLKLTFNRALFPQGLPNVWRVLEGLPVYDPRDGSTGYSDNAALAVAAWMNSDEYGRGIPYGGLNGIDTDALSAAANICDEAVPLAAGGTEKRYTANGVLSSDATFEDNVNKLLSAMAGHATPIGGAWIIKAAAWEAPTVTFDESDFREPFQVQNGLGNDEAFNAIKGKYANPDKLWQPDDFPAIVSAAYEIEDGGDGQGSAREFKDVSLECTNSASMAQRLARIDLRRARQPLTFTAQLRLRALLVQPGDNVAIDFDFLGWSAKAFRVEEMKLVVGFAPGAKAGGDPGIIGADLVLRETAEAIYDWDAALDESGIDPAPNTDFPDVFTVLPASNLRATESLYSTRDGGGVKARVRLAWDASPDAFVQSGGGYRVSYKLAADSVYSVAGVTPALFLDVLDIAAGVYDFKVEAINWAGIASDPLILQQSIAGLSASPAAPTGFTINAIGGLAVLRWDLPSTNSDLDVLQGGFLVVRHSSLSSGATWDSAVSIGEAMAANSMVAVLPLKAGTYLAKFVDASGNYSTTAASFVQSQTSVHTFAALSGGSVVEDPGFTGVKSGTAVDPDDGCLKLDSATDFDDVAEVDAMESWDYPGGVRSSGTYGFHAKMDLGSAKRCRLASAMDSQVYDAFDNFDERPGDVDSWPCWDGDVSGEECDARLAVESTQTDPNGSPTWSAAQRLDQGEFQARGFDFELTLTSSDGNYNIAIAALAVVAEGV